MMWRGKPVVGKLVGFQACALIKNSARHFTTLRTFVSPDPSALLWQRTSDYCCVVMEVGILSRGHRDN